MSHAAWRHYDNDTGLNWWLILVFTSLMAANHSFAHDVIYLSCQNSDKRIAKQLVLHPDSTTFLDSLVETWKADRVITSSIESDCSAEVVKRRMLPGRCEPSECDQEVTVKYELSYSFTIDRKTLGFLGQVYKCTKSCNKFIRQEPHDQISGWCKIDKKKDNQI